MKQELKQTGLRWLWLALLVLVVDQFTKFYVQQHMQLGQSIDVLSFFNLTYLHNYGAAFSFLSEQGGWQRWFFTSIAIVVSGLLLFWLKQTPASQKMLSIGYCLILGGAIGNVWDRLQLGYVVDFLHFYYQNWHYPAFNVADMGICIGAGLLIWDAFFNKEQGQTKGE